MRFVIKHEIKGRLRVHILQSRMSFAQADTLQYYLDGQKNIVSAKIQERTLDVTVVYTGSREEVLKTLENFTYQGTEVPENYLANSGREMNREYKDQLINKVVMHYGIKLFLPMDIRSVITTVKSFKYLWHGVKTLAKGKIEVPVLDATAIGVSVLRGDYDTAGSVMFLLGIGEILEEWTHKKSVADLAGAMALQVENVWLKTGETEVLVPVGQVQVGDQIVVRTGSLIPLDGKVLSGEAMVNQSSMTGESQPVAKGPGSFVYAGTVAEEGECVVQVEKAMGSGRYDRIVKMIEDSEKLKSSAEASASHLADKLVPYTLGGTALTYLITRNVTKTLAVLMVDFSCALKLAMPIAVLSAMRESAQFHISVKGGRFLENMAKADTIVFDKTGTLTYATPTVAQIVPFGGRSAPEMLRLAACLEEHYPHSIANAVVEEAKKRGLDHQEYHSQVQYIVAHGISSMVDGHKVIIGSAHFVFEDEHCVVPEEEQDRFDALDPSYSHLYLCIGGVLAAVLCISDPLRAEASEAIKALHDCGIANVVMMTGDNHRTAQAVAKAVGVDEVHAEVLPEDKANFIRQARQRGHVVIMVGDGVNDSPALSEADVGIAISTGAAIAQEIADITVSSEDLMALVTLRKLSCALMDRIHANYRFIIGFNCGLIGLGLAGILPPTTSALLHNTSTLAISMKSMTNLL